METVIADLKKQLVDQRMELATNIKNGEENLMRTKEGFSEEWKVLWKLLILLRLGLQSRLKQGS